MAKGDWWFKFDFRIWRTDSLLRRCSLETRGFWLECLCVMHESGTSDIAGTFEEVGWLIGCPPEIVARCSVELQRNKTADVTLGNGTVTLVSRRLKRELSNKEQTRLRVQRHRSNSDVTPQSKSNKKEVREEKSANAPTRKPPETQEQWIQTLKSEPIYAHVHIERELRKAEIWIADHPGRKLTKTFFKNWINKIEVPLNIVKPKPVMSAEEIQGGADILASQEAFYGR